MTGYNKDPEFIPLPSTDFGNGDDIRYFSGPAGKKGYLVDYGIYGITETFNAVTTAATIAVGISGDADAHGEEFGLGTSAETSGMISVRGTYSTPSDYDDYIVNPVLPADTVFFVACTAPTGGTPAGIAQPFVRVVWED